MAKPFGEAVTSCPKCGEGIGVEHPYTWCSKCGEPLPQDVLQQIPAYRNRPQVASHGEAVTSSSPNPVAHLRSKSNYKGFRVAVTILAVVGYIGMAVYVMLSLAAGANQAIIALIVAVISVVWIYVSCQALQLLADISDKLVSKE